MNNDRELLELAAKAAGIEGEYLGSGIRTYEAPHHSPELDEFWNPLTDDGDALRLAVKLNLDIVFDCCDRGVSVCCFGNYDQYTGEQCYEEFEREGGAATRRAIVRAAAEIGGAL